MKKIELTILILLIVLSIAAQKTFCISGHKFHVSEIDSIVYKHVSMPSTVTTMSNNGEYSIFVEALQKTGLADSLLSFQRKKDYFMDNPIDIYNNPLYYPKQCDIGYTVFAEKDAVLNAMGINSFDDLTAKCKEWYGNPTWYDYVNEKGVEISTGTDYTNRWNVVNMFVAYHIIKSKMPVNELVYEKTIRNSSVWNYCFGYEPNAYYETMLPNTLLKIWATDVDDTHYNPNLWINRYVKNNTLTDQYGTFGSEAMHSVIYSGAKIYRDGSIETLNAYVHGIDNVLLYDKNAHDALHERMRVDVSCVLPELATNNILRATTNEVSEWNNGGDGNRVALPVDYFENLRICDDNTIMNFTTVNAWRALEGSLLNGGSLSDSFGCIIRLPHVPTGRYEIRIIYPPSARGAETDFFIGNSSNTADMTLVNTLDESENPYESDRIGFKDVDPENEEYGIESDKVMRQNGYMRAPASFSRGTYNTITKKLTVTSGDPYSACKQMTGGTSCRTESGYGTMMLRYIVATMDIHQGQDYWLMVKGKKSEASPYNLGLSFHFDFVELVPVDIADNETYMEDWY